MEVRVLALSLKEQPVMSTRVLEGRVTAEP
jgi:hypothetical protein